MALSELLSKADTPKSVNELITTILEGGRSINFHNVSINALDHSLLNSSTTRRKLSSKAPTGGKNRIALISEAVAHSNSLLQLSLLNNDLGDENGEILFQSFLQNESLTSISVVMNNIGMKAAMVIAKALKRSKTLTVLNLSFNKLGKRGCEAIAQSLGKNNSLLKLGLVQTGVTEKTGKMLLAALQTNKSLVELSLEKNSITTKTMEHIQAKLRMNGKFLAKEILNSLAGEEKVPWNRVICAVVGEGRKGKTSLIRALTDQPFLQDLESTPSIIINSTIARTYGSWILCGKRENANDIACRKALNSINIVGKQAEVQQRLPMLEGASDSLSEILNTENTEDDSQFLSEYKKLASNASLRLNSISLVFWDFGGQDIFRAIHPLFLSKHSIYLVVFDIRTVDSKKRGNLEHLEFWLKTISLFAPSAPILLVATFLAKYDGNITRVQEALTEVGDAISSFIVKNQDLLFFPVDNQTNEGISMVKECIESISREQECVNYEIPISWVQCLDDMESQGKKTGWTSFDLVKEIAYNHKVPVDQVHSMLEVFHNFGAILYFENTTTLRETIITNPQLVIDSIYVLVHDPSVHEPNQKQREKLKCSKLEVDYERFCNTGEISYSVLECLWGPEKTDFMLDLTKSLLMLSEWHVDGHEMTYFVPRMAPGKNLKDFGIQPEGLQCSFTFAKNYLPDGVFERLVCLCVSYSGYTKSPVKPILTLSSCMFGIRDLGLIYCIKETSRILVIFEEEQAMNNVINLISSILRKIRNDLSGFLLEWDMTVEEGTLNSVDGIVAAKSTAEAGMGHDIDLFLDSL